VPEAVKMKPLRLCYPDVRCDNNASTTANNNARTRMPQEINNYYHTTPE
jgi:hypothetical protein